MKRIIFHYSVFIVLLAALFTLANWAALTAPASINFIVATVTAPLGLLVLGFAAAAALGFGVVIAVQHWSAAAESRKLLGEVHRLQGLADQAEASRIDSLHRLLADEFRAVTQRLDRIETQQASLFAARSAA